MVDNYVICNSFGVPLCLDGLFGGGQVCDVVRNVVTVRLNLLRTVGGFNALRAALKKVDFTASTATTHPSNKRLHELTSLYDKDTIVGGLKRRIFVTRIELRILIGGYHENPQLTVKCSF